jgi:hypothetical protein
MLLEVLAIEINRLHFRRKSFCGIVQQQRLTTSPPGKNRMILSGAHIFHRVPNVYVGNGVITKLNAKTFGYQLPQSCELF